jgi:hypothetical protein
MVTSICAMSLSSGDPDSTVQHGAQAADRGVEPLADLALMRFERGLAPVRLVERAGELGRRRIMAALVRRRGFEPGERAFESVLSLFQSRHDAFDPRFGPDVAFGAGQYAAAPRSKIASAVIQRQPHKPYGDRDGGGVAHSSRMVRKTGQRDAAPAAVIVHSLEHARAACRAARALGRPLCLRSAPAAAGYAGPAWFREIGLAIAEEFPDVAAVTSLDCGDAPGDALAALRAGVKTIRLRVPRRVRDKVVAIAAASGARLDDDRRRALDLDGLADPESACRDWLARRGPARPPARPRARPR